MIDDDVPGKHYRLFMSFSTAMIIDHEPGHHYAEYGHGDHANHAPHHYNGDDDDSVCSS